MGVCPKNVGKTLVQVMLLIGRNEPPVET